MGDPILFSHTLFTAMAFCKRNALPVFHLLHQKLLSQGLFSEDCITVHIINIPNVALEYIVTKRPVYFSFQRSLTTKSRRYELSQCNGPPAW